MYFMLIISSTNLLFCAQSEMQIKPRCSLKRVLIASYIAISQALGALQSSIKKDIEPAHTADDVCLPYKFPTHHVEYLIPPVLDTTESTVEYCDRPKRSEGINISLEQDNNKTVVHCYGHGGSGYVTLFGSIEKAINLLRASNPDHEKPIRIIGSGCMGLTMAAELYRDGFHHITISTDELYDIPSWRAGGFFDPGTGMESTPREQAQLKLSLDTFETYRLIEQGKHPYLSKNVVKRLPLYSASHVHPDVEVLESLGYMPAREYVSLDFGKVRHENYRKFHTYFIDVTEVMKQLWQEVSRLGIDVEMQKVESFNELDESIIVNCAGLGAGRLNADSAVYPSRGHFMMLPAAAEHADYMLFTKVKQDDNDETLYFFPKGNMVSSKNKHGKSSAGMLGGTFIPNVDKLDKRAQEELNKKEFKKLAQRANRFFYGDEEERSNGVVVAQQRSKAKLRDSLKNIIAQKKEARSTH